MKREELQEYNTKLLMHIASFMAKNRIVDISYNQIEDIMLCLEDEAQNRNDKT